MTNQTNVKKLGAIFGGGRSGTTWLGSVISSHPDIAYRFEPFHRLQSSSSNKALKEIRHKIESSPFSSEDLSRLYEALLPATPSVDKPPYFKKNFERRSSKGQQLIYPLARKTKVFADIFRYLYTPQNSPMIVFKEVSLVKLLVNLLEETNIPIVYLIRHPCGVIASRIRGQNESLMPDGRRVILKNLLVESQLEWAEEYITKLDNLTIYEQESLLWAVDVEICVKTCQSQLNGLLVVYEHLTEEPFEVYKKVFNHFGLELGPESKNFLEETTQGTSNGNRNRYEGNFINPYFSVFRDPKVSRDKWKTQLSSEQQKGIMAIVEKTAAFQLISNQAFW